MTRPPKRPPEAPIAVVMAAYNAEDVVERAINSILSQTHAAFEFVIVDDGSTDRTLEIPEAHARRDARISLIVQENQGLTRSLNTAIRASDGRYIARQDADDVSLPTRLEKQIAYMEAHPETVLLGTRAFEVCDRQRNLGPFIDERAMPERLLRRNPLPHTSAMIRRDAFARVGLYDESYRTAQDYEAWLRLSEVGRVAMLEEPLVEYHIHAGSVSAARRFRQAINGYRARRGRIGFLTNAWELAFHLAVGSLPKSLTRLRRRMKNR